MEKINRFESVEKELIVKGYTFERKDWNRPWGGFWVIKEEETHKFIQEYFPNLNPDEIIKGNKISPKILLVAPGKRLSWQYHHRRKEIWQILDGPVEIVRSDTDEEKDRNNYNHGDQLVFTKGERHRLVGLENWGKVAEIWIHTDLDNPSDEDDIVRLQDDFKRG